MIRTKDLNNRYDLGSMISETNSFSDLQGFSFGICSYLRGYLTWGKIKESYNKFKHFFGVQSMILHRIKHSDFNKLPRREEQYLVYSLLQTLFEAQTEFRLQMALEGQCYHIYKWDLLQTTVINQIWDDSVNDPLNPVVLPKISLHPEVLKVIKAIRQEERYKELPILADCIEDFHGGAMMDFCDHFRSDCIHTYTCKYFRVLPVK